MKIQALFSSKDKSIKLKCRLLQFLFGVLRVKFMQLAKAKYNWYMQCTTHWLKRNDHPSFRRKIL